jgi:hypothetical protein
MKKILLVGIIVVIVGSMFIELPKNPCNILNVAELQSMKQYQLMPLYCEYSEMTLPEEQCKIEQAKVEKVLRSRTLMEFNKDLIEACKLR